MKEVRKTLELAWLDRWNQRLESAMQKLAEAQTAQGWEELSPEGLMAQTQTQSPVQEIYLEALLLKASFVRAQGTRQKYSSLLQKIAKAWDETKQAKNFRLLFELGLDHWIDHDLARALEYFLLAEKKADGTLQRLFSLMNILLCLEALDLSRQDTEKSFATLVQGLSEFESTHSRHVLEQWQAYNLRRDFYQKLKLPEGKLSGQSEFFQQWVHGLPYLKTFSETELPQDYLWQGSYRLRTLARIWIPADHQSFRVSDAIDRLYLWTWLAMAGKPEMTREKVIFTLDSILKDFEFENQAKENLLLLRNSLGWLRILYPHLKAHVQKLYMRLQQQNSVNYPVLEAEYDLMLHLSGEIHSDSHDRLFSKYPEFEKIYQDMQSRFPVLQERLMPLMSQARHFDLIIDESRNELLLPKEGRIVSSKALTQLLAKLAQEGTITETEIEALDLSNLLYRARKILGPQSIEMKSGTVSTGKKWPKCLVLNDIELSSYHMKVLRPSLPESEAHLQAARALFPESFKRKDLEKKLAVSKASANRMLENWLNQGQVTLEGKAKAATYYWSEV